MPDSTRRARRRLIACLGSGVVSQAFDGVLPGRWIRPLVDSVVLPAHAQASGPAPVGFLCTTTSFTLDPGDPPNAQTLVPPPPTCNPGDGVNAIVRFSCLTGTPPSALVEVPSPAGANWAPNPALSQTLTPGDSSNVDVVLTHSTGDQFRVMFTARVTLGNQCVIDPIMVIGPL